MKPARKKLITLLKPYWKLAKKVEGKYWSEINKLEESMKKELGVEFELFHVDGNLVGIGDYEKTIKLITAEKLENS